MKRAASADERARQLEIGTRVDEHPCILLAESEESELVEPPADDALVLEGRLESLRWVLRRRHVLAETNGTGASLLAERKAWLRTGCGHAR
jgi:hypothetical protein